MARSTASGSRSRTSRVRIESNPDVLPLWGQWVDPRLQMPYTRQTAFGWSHQFNNSTVLVADFVRNDGRDLNVRPRINTRPVGQPGAPRRLEFLNLQPNAPGTRPAVSLGESEYTALILGLRRRMSNGLQFNVNYTLAEAKSDDWHVCRSAEFATTFRKPSCSTTTRGCSVRRARPTRGTPVPSPQSGR